MAFKFSVDSDLPLPLGIQLRGLIEFGISCGELTAGSRLPPVRRMAEEIGTSPMTVFQVYKQLQENGLLEGRSGQGTFVCTNAHTSLSSTNDLETLQLKIDELVEVAIDKGISRPDLTRLFSARINYSKTLVPSIQITMVGHFLEANREYVSNLRGQVPKRDMINSVTLSELRESEALRREMAQSDMIITFANRKAEVVQLLNADCPVVAISYIPSGKTLMALAALDPMKSVGIISTFAEFLPLMKAGVHRHAPQIAHLKSAILGHGDVHGIIRDSDILIYATGIEEAFPHLPKLSHAFEYRHILHPHEIKNNILPVIEKLRAKTVARAKN